MPQIGSAYDTLYMAYLTHSAIFEDNPEDKQALSDLINAAVALHHEAERNQR